MSDLEYDDQFEEVDPEEFLLDEEEELPEE